MKLGTIVGKKVGNYSWKRPSSRPRFRLGLGTLVGKDLYPEPSRELYGNYSWKGRELYLERSGTIVGKVGKLESFRLIWNQFFTFYREFFRWYFYRSSNEVHVIVSRNSFWVYFFFFPIVWLPRPDPLNQRVKIRVPLNLESSHARPLNVVNWRLDRRSVSDQIQSSRYQESTISQVREFKASWWTYPFEIPNLFQSKWYNFVLIYQATFQQEIAKAVLDHQMHSIGSGSGSLTELVKFSSR